MKGKRLIQRVFHVYNDLKEGVRKIKCVVSLLRILPHVPVTYCPHTEAEIKWPTFYRRHFQIHFSAWSFFLF